MANLKILGTLIIIIAIFSLLQFQQKTYETQTQILQTPIPKVDPYKLVKLDQSKGAMCLDGTAPAFYVAEGSPDNFMLAFEGGGWCYGTTLDSTLESCLSRSKGNLGSSKEYPEYANFDGILSREQSHNKFFNNYTTLYIKYCDGTGHQGYATDPIDVKGEKIWMRGHLNTIQTIQYALQNLGMKNAKKVVVTGFSAGGLATYEWVDHIKSTMEIANPDATVLGIPDGFFLDFKNKDDILNYRLKFQNFLHFSNKEIDPPNYDCVNFYKPSNETWKCMFAQYLLPFIKTPLFNVISAYDAWSIPNILEIPCTNQHKTLTECSKTEVELIEEYRSTLLQILYNFTSINQDWSAWTPSCIDHTYAHSSSYYSTNYEVPMKSGWTLQTSIGSWLGNHLTKPHIDTVAWPGNTPCDHK